MPARLKLSRKKGWRKPEGSVVVDRRTVWGNPFRISADSPSKKSPWSVRHVDSTALIARFETKMEAQAEAVRLFEMWFDDTIAEPGTVLHNFRNKYGWKGFSLACAVRMLKGKDLLCSCKIGDPCHGDIILRKANS